MTDTPADVLAIADGIAKAKGYISIWSPSQELRHRLIEIAEHVLAERKRCATIADQHAEVLRDNFARFEAIAVEGVAKEIRA